MPLLVIGVAYAPHMFAACLILMGVGFVLLILQSLAITLVQFHTPDRVRGRVMTIYSMCHAGSDTGGNMVIGTLAVSLGLPLALTVGSVVALFVSGGLNLSGFSGHPAHAVTMSKKARRLRQLPPSAVPVTLADLRAGLGASSTANDAFRAALAVYYQLPIEACYLATSGRSVIYTLLKGLSEERPDRRQVVMPAYTCPVIPKVALDLRSGTRLLWTFSPSQRAMYRSYWTRRPASKRWLCSSFTLSASRCP